MADMDKEVFTEKSVENHGWSLFSCGCMHVRHASLQCSGCGVTTLLMCACGLPSLRLWKSGTHVPTMRVRRSATCLLRRVEDNVPFQRHACGDAKRGRAVCPHTAVNAQPECSTAAARTPAMASALRMYPQSGASRASGGYRGAFGWGMRGRLALPCGHAGRMTLLAAVAERQPYRNGRESGSCADGMSVNLTKYIRRRYIICVVLCNKRLSSAQFCNGLVIVLQKGGLHRAA